MVTFAVISDIHGNIEALSVVMNAIDKEKVDFIVCVGDIVGYYPYPNECVDIIRENCRYVISGNHDRCVVSPDLKEELSFYNPIASRALVWTVKRLTPDSIDFLRQLKVSLKFKADNKEVFVVHGTPNDPDEYFMAINSQEVSQYQKEHVENWFRLLSVDLIILGHTHMPFVYEANDKIIFNPGSVGQPRDGIPLSSYAIVKGASNRFDVTIYRCKFDIDKVCRSIKKVNLPTRLCDRLYKGY